MYKAPLHNIMNLLNYGYGLARLLDTPCTYLRNVKREGDKR